MLHWTAFLAAVALAAADDGAAGESSSEAGSTAEQGSEPAPAPAPEPAPAPQPDPAPAAVPAPQAPAAEPERAPTTRAPTGQRRTSLGSLRFGGSGLGGVAVSSEGLATLVGGAYGAYAGTATALAAFGDDSAGAAAPGFLLGATLGGVGGYALAHRQEASVDQVVLVGSSAAYGTFLGYQTTRLAIAPGATEEARRIQAGGVLGSMIGAGVGLLSASHSPDRARTVQADLGLTTGWLAGTGVVDLMGLDVHDDRVRRVPVTTLTATASGLVGLGAGAWGWRRPAPGVSMLAMGQGTWLGFWAPSLVETDDFWRRAWAGGRVGLGAGQLVSYGLAGLGEPDETAIVYQATGAAFGNALGAGVPLLVQGEDADLPGVIAPMMAGSLGGQVVGGLLAPRLGDLEGDDALFPMALGSWTLWQSVGWGTCVAQLQDDQPRGVGAALTLFGAGGVATMGLAGHAHVSPQATALMFSSGAWGSGLGALTGLAAGLDGPENLALSLGVGDLALLGSGVVVAGSREPSWGTVARVNGGMAVGGALGALGAVIFAYDNGHPGTAAAATVVGSGLGLGAALLIPGSDRPAEQASRIPRGLHLPHLPVQASWSVAPWTAEDGSHGAFLSVQGHDHAGR